MSLVLTETRLDRRVAEALNKAVAFAATVPPKKADTVDVELVKARLVNGRYELVPHGTYTAPRTRVVKRSGAFSNVKASPQLFEAACCGDETALHVRSDVLQASFIQWVAQQKGWTPERLRLANRAVAVLQIAAAGCDPVGHPAVLDDVGSKAGKGIL